MAKNLTDLAERTATADTDLMHINSGGTDYKETKANFVKDLVQTITFSNTSSLLGQVDELSAGTYMGSIASYGHQTETGVPGNYSFYVEARVSSSLYATVRLFNTASTFREYVISKQNGTWDAEWKELPSGTYPKMALGIINAGASMTISASLAICFFYLGTAQTAILGCRSGSIAVFEQGSSISSNLTWSVSGTTYTFTNPSTSSGTRYCIISI